MFLPTTTKFKIRWTCMNSGRSGVSRETYEDKSIAEDVVEELNETYPNVAHYVVAEETCAPQQRQGK